MASEIAKKSLTNNPCRRAHALTIKTPFLARDGAFYAIIAWHVLRTRILPQIKEDLEAISKKDFG
jgi:hypothetical protein